MEKDNNEEQRYSDRLVAFLWWTQGHTGTSFGIVLLGVIGAGIAHILPPSHRIEFDWRIAVAWGVGVFIFRALKRRGSRRHWFRFRSRNRRHEDHGPKAWISDWEEAKSSAVEIGRKDLIRNNEEHIGKLVYFDNAYVVQTLDDGLIINRKVDRLGNTLKLIYPHTPLRIIAGDTIGFVAEVIGVDTYESVSYAMITSPVLSVVALRLQK